VFLALNSAAYLVAGTIHTKYLGMARNSRTKGKGTTYTSAHSLGAPMKVNNETDTDADNATETATNMEVPMSSMSCSPLVTDLHACKVRIEELADNDYSQEWTAERVIERLGIYSNFMHRFLDRRLCDSETMRLMLPSNIQAELCSTRDNLEMAWTDRIMDYLSDKAADVVARSKSSPRSIGFEDEFSKLGRQITYACGTMRGYNADINHEHWQCFVPRCVNHNIHAIFRRLLKAHKHFQTSLYLRNDKEHVRLWYLTWHNLRKTFKLLQRDEDKFPSAEYCIESSFFRTKEIRELFELSTHQADFFIPREIENIVGYYCAIIDDHHSQTKPKSGHLRGLSGNRPLSATAMSALTEFPDNNRWKPAALNALHWAAMRLNHLTGGPMVFRRNGAAAGAWTADSHDQVVLDQLDQQIGIDAESLTHGSPWLKDNPTSAKRVSVVDIDNILEESPVLTASTAPSSANLAPHEALSLVETVSPATSFQTSPEQPGDPIVERHQGPISPEGLATAPPYTPAQASPTSSPYAPLLPSVGRKGSFYNGLPTPQILPFSSPTGYESVMGGHYRVGDDIESQDSVSMDISPTSDDNSQAVDSSAVATEAALQLPIEDEEMPMASEHKIEGVNDLSTFQRPGPRGQNRLSAYDYVYCPFPENRKYEVANSRLISRDLREPGIVSDGLRSRDLVNLPPPHCRTPGTFSTWKKRTPFGPYEIFKLFGSAVVKKAMGRKSTPTTRPRFPPSLTSRASCQHYKHVHAATRDSQRRVAKLSQRRIPMLRGGGARGWAGFPRRRPGQPSSGFRERAPNSPTPVGPRPTAQRHTDPTAPADGVRSRSRSRSRVPIPVVDLTDSDHPPGVEDQEEDNDDDDDHRSDFHIYHDEGVDNSARQSTSPGGISNKENAEQGASSGSRRPLQIRGSSWTPIPSGNIPILNSSSVSRSPPNTPNLGRWHRCHPCPVYPNQYHHQCWGQHCAGFSPRGQSAPPAAESEELRPSVPPRSQPLGDYQHRSPPYAQFQGHVPRSRDSAFFHGSRYVYLLQEGGRTRLPTFPPRLSEMCADDVPENTIYAAEDGILYVLRTGPSGARALTRLTESIPRTEDYWHLRHVAATWQVVAPEKCVVRSQITLERLMPTGAGDHGRALLDDNRVGRMYQLTTGDIVRVNRVAESVVLELLRPERQTQAARPPDQLLHAFGPLDHAVPQRDRGTHGGYNVSPRGTPARGVHHGQVADNRPTPQDGSPSRRDFGAQSPRDSTQETLGALPGGSRMHALHERLRVQKANAENREQMDRLRDDLLARADDIDRLAANAIDDNILGVDEAESVRLVANNLWPNLRQAPNFRTWQETFAAARAQLTLASQIVHGGLASKRTGDEDEDSTDDDDKGKNEPVGTYGQPPAQRLAHIAHQGLAVMNGTYSSLGNVEDQSQDHEHEKSPRRTGSHHDEESDESHAMDKLLGIAETSIDNLEVLLRRYRALPNLDLSNGRSTEEGLSARVAEWVMYVDDIGDLLNNAASAGNQEAIVTGLHTAQQAIENLTAATEAIEDTNNHDPVAGHQQTFSSNQLWSFIQEREAALIAEHEDLLDVITGFVRVPPHARDALQAAQDALQDIRALADDTEPIRLHEVVNTADEALASLREAIKPCRQNENADDDGSGEGADQTEDDDSDAGDQLQDNLDRTTSFSRSPEGEHFPVANNGPGRNEGAGNTVGSHPAPHLSGQKSDTWEDETEDETEDGDLEEQAGEKVPTRTPWAFASTYRERDASDSSDEARITYQPVRVRFHSGPFSVSSSDKTESDTAPPPKQADSPHGRGVARKASAAARERHAAVQAARQADAEPKSGVARKPIAEKKGKKPQPQPRRKGADESDAEDPKTKKGKRKDDDSDDDQPGGNPPNAAKASAAPPRRSTRIAAKAAAPAQSGGAKSGSKAGGRSKKRPAAEDDINPSSDPIAHDDPGSGFSICIPPRKKSKLAASTPQPVAIAMATEDSTPSQTQRQRKQSLADQKLDELRGAARSRLQDVFAKHGLQLYGTGTGADADAGRAYRERKCREGAWVMY